MKSGKGFNEMVSGWDITQGRVWETDSTRYQRIPHTRGRDVVHYLGETSQCPHESHQLTFDKIKKF